MPKGKRFGFAIPRESIPPIHPQYYITYSIQAPRFRIMFTTDLQKICDIFRMNSIEVENIRDFCEQMIKHLFMAMETRDCDAAQTVRDIVQRLVRFVKDHVYFHARKLVVISVLVSYLLEEGNIDHLEWDTIDTLIDLMWEFENDISTMKIKGLIVTSKIKCCENLLGKKYRHFNKSIMW